jgi:geranylgeranyl diphosphate synthase type II
MSSQTQISVKDLLKAGVARTDAALERLLPSADTQPHSIHRAMRHSTFAGGKRLRPLLCMEAARMVAGHDVPGVEELGAAIEMLHTYSLIHDDLPALDNDDLRRGKPTCHVVYGEAIAILAGDALQTLAFETLANLKCPAPQAISIVREVAIAVNTGVSPDRPGMIGGQVMDIESEGRKPTAELVEIIHRAKTGALITVSIVAGGIYGIGHLNEDGFIPGPDATVAEFDAYQTSRLKAQQKAADTIARLRIFGQKAGLAFQIVDDVLDMTQDSAQLGKTAGKDVGSDKATWPAVYGIEKSQQDAERLITEAFAQLTPFGDKADALKSLASYLVERKN